MNQNYAKAKSALLRAEIDWLNDNIKMAVLGTSYTGGSVAIDNDEFYTAIHAHVMAGGTAIKTLTGKAVTVGTSPVKEGVADADDVTFVSITAGHTVGFFVFFKDPDGANIDGPPATGDRASARLIHLIDSGPGIGYGTNGGNFTSKFQAAGIIEL
jgi:hypothetical protein